jgi:uncharacterized alkaline shock family protein YloU
VTLSGSTPYILGEIDEDGIAGTVAVAPTVLVDIICMAAESVPATVRVVGNRRGGSQKAHIVTHGPTQTDHDGWFEDRGVRLRIHDDQFETAVSVELRQGAIVPDVAAEIQSEVSLIIERMLGMRASSIAVHVLGFEPENDTE